MKIFLGSDHAGYKLKEEIKKYLDRIKVSYEDLGNGKLDNKDDYPDYAFLVAKKVAGTANRGILICDSGVGMQITANKVKGIRAVNPHNLKMAQKSREHNNTNVLCLAADYLKPDQAKKITKAWLTTKFSKAARHNRRVNKISRIEKKK